MKWTGLWIAAIGLLCVAAAIGYATREYDLRSREVAAAINAQTAVMKSQAVRRYYEEKLAAYERATEAASKIAALKSAGASEAQLQDSVTQFKTILWGPVSVTDGESVNTALQLFNGALDAGADANQLQQLSVALSHVCSNEARAAFPPAGQEKPDSSFAETAAILAGMREVARGPEAQLAATQWLASVDAGQYADSWKGASQYFQDNNAEDQWEHKIGSLRKLLGPVSTRKLKSEDAAKTADGDRMVVQFDTAFAQKPDAVEVVTTMCDKDGIWRVAAYSIK